MSGLDATLKSAVSILARFEIPNKDKTNVIEFIWCLTLSCDPAIDETVGHPYTVTWDALQAGAGTD